MAKPKSKLKPLPKSDFTLHWDAGRTQCTLRRKGEDPAKLGCGVTDAISVYSNRGKMLVLSINYPARYACLESFGQKGLDQAVMAEPKDIDRMFGGDFASTSPKTIGERLFKELD